MPSAEKPDHNSAPDDIKDRMREALERKKDRSPGRTRRSAGAKEKVHGSEVAGGAGPKMHRRKAGGGGS